MKMALIAVSVFLLVGSVYGQHVAEGMYMPPCQECYSAGPDLSSITLGQYNVTFNFSGMNEYKLDGCISPYFFEPDPNSKYQQQSYGWSGQAKFSIKQHENSYVRDSKISFEIGAGVASDLHVARKLLNRSEEILKSDLDPEIKAMYLQEIDPCRGKYNCGFEEIKNISWRSYQNENEEKRPIPKSNFYFDAIISPNESIEIQFENVSKPIVDQFMNSLNITGLGIHPTVESWDDYVARVRRPSEDDPGISALEFIDKMYPTYVYDTNNTTFIEINEFGKIKVPPIKTIEAEAIRYHYYEPIPLPMNVSLDAPNGDEVPQKEPKVNATVPKNSIFNESNLIQWGIQGPVMDRTASMDIFYRALNANESEYEEYHYSGKTIQDMVTEFKLTSDPRIVDVLINALKKNPYRTDTYYNEDILDALSRFGKLAVNPLIQVLLDEKTDPITRSSVAGTLGYIGEMTGDTTVIEPLVESLKYGDEDAGISNAIERMGESALDQLNLALTNENQSMRENAATVLERLRSSLE